MPGLSMNMGLGGSYAGPVYGGDGVSAADVPVSTGYPDTSTSAMTFGPGGAGMGRNPTVHAFGFGVACFAILLFMAWALPR